MRIGIDATPLPARPAGAGTYILQLIQALADSNEGHDLIVFVQRSRSNLFQDNPSRRFMVVPVSDMPPALRLIWEQVSLPRLCRDHQLDLLHSLHYTSPARSPCLSVVTFHDMTFFMYPQLHTLSKRVLFPIFIRSSARQANALIAVSEATRQDAIRLLKIPPEKITTIPNGVAAHFHPLTDQVQLEACRQRYSLPKDFILYVGTMEPRKDLPLLIRAFQRLVQEDTSHHLVLVGRQGWMVGELGKTIKQFQLEPFIHTTGYVPYSDLPMIYNLARVFVYPSIYEGFGFPPVEAMACGTPVIATSIPVNRDHIGEAGLLLPPGDEDSLFDNLSRLIKDRQFREELSARGIQRSKAFSWRKSALSTMEVYSRLAHP